MIILYNEVDDLIFGWRQLINVFIKNNILSKTSEFINRRIL